jgi:hypothetical protein
MPPRLHWLLQSARQKRQGRIPASPTLPRLPLPHRKRILPSELRQSERLLPPGRRPRSPERRRADTAEIIRAIRPGLTAPPAQSAVIPPTGDKAIRQGLQATRDEDTREVPVKVLRDLVDIKALEDTREVKDLAGTREATEGTLPSLTIPTGRVLKALEDIRDLVDTKAAKALADTRDLEDTREATEETLPSLTTPTGRVLKALEDIRDLVDIKALEDTREDRALEGTRDQADTKDKDHIRVLEDTKDLEDTRDPEDTKDLEDIKGSRADTPDQGLILPQARPVLQALIRAAPGLRDLAVPEAPAAIALGIHHKADPWAGAAIWPEARAQAAMARAVPPMVPLRLKAARQLRESQLHEGSPVS